MKEKSADDTEDWVPEALPIPSHWIYAGFELAFENVSLTGLKIPQKEYGSTGEFPIVDQGNELIGGYTDDADKVIAPERDAIIFCDHTKCFKYADFSFAPGADGVKVLVPREPIVERFAFYGCKSLRLPDRGYSRHYSFLKKSKFPLAPVAEQNRIVAKIEELFSELDKGIESLKTAREQLKVYRQAVLKHAFEGKLTAQWREENKDKLETADQLLARIKKERETRYQQQLGEWKAAVKAWEVDGKPGRKPSKPKKPIVTGNPGIPEELESHCTNQWPWLRLDDISAVSGGLTKNQKRNSLQKKMKYLRVANVYADKLILDDITEIGVTEEEFDKLKLVAGDLLVVEGNGSIDQIGRLAVWTGEIDQIGHQNHLIRVRLIDGMLSRFFLLFLLSQLGRKFIIKQASSTSGLHTLSISKVSGLPVPVPSHYEQEAILSEVDELLSQLEMMEGGIVAEENRSEALRQSILKKAFSGQLVPQDPSDEPASVLLERIKTEKAKQTKPGKKKKRKTAA